MLSGYLAANEYSALIGAFRGLVRQCGGPNAASNIARVSQQQISRYMSASPEHARQFPPLDVIADLEAECGQPRVTKLLAEMEGFVLVPLPKARGGDDAVELIARVSGMLHEVADVSGGVAEALRDDCITEAECEHLHGQIREAQEALASLDQQIDQMKTTAKTAGVPGKAHLGPTAD